MNARYGPRMTAPYATTYFPGVARQEARAVDIGDGERKTGFTIVVAPLPETTVSGVVSYADGRPVAGAHVFPFAAPRKPTDVPSVVTDRDGTFELRVLAGLTYVMIASVETREGLRKGETTVAVDRETRGVRVVIREP